MGATRVNVISIAVETKEGASVVEIIRELREKCLADFEKGGQIEQIVKVEKQGIFAEIGYDTGIRAILNIHIKDVGGKLGTSKVIYEQVVNFPAKTYTLIATQDLQGYVVYN